MKQKLIATIGSLLTTCMAFSWTFGTDWVSLILIGEYPYPQESED